MRILTLIMMMVSLRAVAAPLQASGAAAASPARIEKRADGSLVVHHQLLDWPVPKGWDVSFPGAKTGAYETDIELKNKATTISVFISKNSSGNFVALHETRLKMEHDKKVARQSWNGSSWVVAEFEKKGFQDKRDGGVDLRGRAEEGESLLGAGVRSERSGKSGR